MKQISPIMIGIARSLTVASMSLTVYGQDQSALNAAGIQAERLESLWWLFFYICAAVYVTVMAVLLTALFRTQKAESGSSPDIKPDENRERDGKVNQ